MYNIYVYMRYECVVDTFCKRANDSSQILLNKYIKMRVFCVFYDKNSFTFFGSFCHHKFCSPCHIFKKPFLFANMNHIHTTKHDLKICTFYCNMVYLRVTFCCSFFVFVSHIYFWVLAAFGICVLWYCKLFWMKFEKCFFYRFLH